MNHTAHKYTVPAISCLKKYGVNKKTARYMINNLWRIPTEYQSILATYNLLHWEAEYFLERAMVDGTVTKDGTLYQVIYHRCNAYEVYKASGKFKLVLSFRELKSEFGIFPTVLVTVANTGKWSKRG